MPAPATTKQTELLQTYQAIFFDAGWSFTHYYLTYAQTHLNDFDALEPELPNFSAIRTWLLTQNNPQSARLLLALLEYLTPFLHRPEFAAELVGYCQAGLQACHRLKANPGWVLLLRYQAYNYLGEWDRALADAQAAANITQDTDPVRHARALLSLGSLQFNRGDYAVALETLAHAEAMLRQVNDIEGVATARAQFAAYHLNRGELDQALAMYQAVDRLRRQVDPTSPTDHTLLMLGVVYREKGNYHQAARYLSQLRQRGAAEGKRGVEATASHHLAWLYLKQNMVPEAYQLARRAKQLYLEISDPRGASDADEQLGLIALLKGDDKTAVVCFQQALETRQHLGNQQGVASCLRHLSNLYARQGNIRLGLYYLGRSILLYRRIGVLSRQRVVKMAKQFWQIVMVERRR